MVKIKYLVSDIDGTLLRNFGFIFSFFSSKTIKELEEFCSNNRQLVLASGRDLARTQKIAEKVEMKINKKAIPYLICLNGALVFDNYGKRVIFNKKFGANSCWNIVNFLVKKKISFFLLTKDNKVIFPKTLFSILVYLLFFKKYKASFFKISKFSFDDIQKISLISFFPTNKKLRKEIMENFGANFYCSSVSKFYLELIDKSINKFYAWQAISKRMNISKNEWCAIGNEENDILLLENSAFGVFVDAKKAKHLNIDPIKFNFKTSNKKGFAVGNSIEEMRKHQYY